MPTQYLKWTGNITYRKRTIYTNNTIIIYLFVLDRDGFLLCEYKDDGAAEGSSGHCSVIKCGGSLSLLAFTFFLAS